ncbi:unnamed protein product [Acanthosepion pharaonis]|uniref:Uncharacterized protein n=1 Tax=Acanthosepion pharaonis TaxID=158019 RepID=A0A812DAK1_ACAPH|nr:unnamed protein product [Sepia pharaonis]
MIRRVITSPRLRIRNSSRRNSICSSRTDSPSTFTVRRTRSHSDASAAQHHGLGLLAAAQQHLDPHRHFGKVEGLGQIIVAPARSPQSAHRHRSTRSASAREWWIYRSRSRATSDRPAPATSARTGIAIASMCHLMPMLLQLGDDRRSGRAVVFDDRDSRHAIGIAARPIAPKPRRLA